MPAQVLQRMCRAMYEYFSAQEDAFFFTATPAVPVEAKNQISLWRAAPRYVGHQVYSLPSKRLRLAQVHFVLCRVRVP